MKMRRLGSNGPEISAVGYGAWEIGGDLWGPNPEVDDLIHAMHAGFDEGITWVDTAEVYGSGTSEEIAGKALKDRRGVMVFTKLAPTPSGTGFRPGEVRAGCDASLKRLGRDVIDLYQLHWRSNDVPMEDTWGAMAELVEAGKARYIGVSNFDRDLLSRCEAIRHVDSLQPELSMLHRAHLNSGLLSFCEENGTGAICYGPLAYGLLTGTITPDTKFHPKDWRSGDTKIGYYERLFKPGVIEGHMETIDALRPIADRVGCSLAQLALAWAFHQPAVAGAIAGSRKAEHVAENAAAGDVTLSEKDLEDIHTILEG